MDEHIVIFGASGGAVKVIQAMINLGISIEFVIDNDKKKQDGLLEGLPIKGPEALLDGSAEYRIVIASVYHSEIKAQLIQMGIKEDHIVLAEKYILASLHSDIPKLAFNRRLTIDELQKRNILIELAEGFTLGGIEKWSISLAEGFYVRGDNVSLITRDNEEGSLRGKEYVKFFDLDFRNYKESVLQLADFIIRMLPCTVIISKINQVFMAASIIKSLYPEHIRIISVLHSDFIRHYEQNAFLEPYIDSFLFVSDDMGMKFIENYNIDSSKLYFKDKPIEYEVDYVKEYSDIGTSIRIGYGGRLEKAQKRADLLIPLMEQLEASGMNFVLNIAGAGGCYDKIKDYVDSRHLEDKVRLYGVIPFEYMKDFWKNCDLFINLSDIEASSLSMLEAMSYGCVPIVTNTSGTGSYIQSGVNGFITDLEDIDAITSHIAELERDRNKLKEMGRICREIIRSKCDPKDYLDFIENLANA